MPVAISVSCVLSNAGLLTPSYSSYDRFSSTGMGRTDGREMEGRRKGGRDGEREAGRVGHSKGTESNRVHHEGARVASSSQ